MAFISELMPEEQKQNLPFEVETLPNGSRPTLWKWVVDRERHAFVVQIKKEGGGYEGTREYGHYVLSWNGEIVRFGGSYVVSGDPTEGLTVEWLIDRLVIPDHLTTNASELKVLIHEALDAIGWLFSRAKVRLVSVTFLGGAAK